MTRAIRILITMKTVTITTTMITNTIMIIMTLKALRPLSTFY